MSLGNGGSRRREKKIRLKIIIKIMDKNTKITIFIVEDNKVFTLALKADIEVAFKDMRALRICSFETGEACMEEFTKEKPQIVILDYHLNSKNPDAVDGIKVLDMIKKINPDTNVIILSSDDSIDIALKAFHHEASDYVVKTETKFRKINYSLFNIIKIIEAKNEAKIYKNVIVFLGIFITLIVGAVIATGIIKPEFFK
jgi:DNA-binding NtrC family response regulator